MPFTCGKPLYEFTDSSGCCFFSLISGLGASVLGIVAMVVFINALLNLGMLIFILAVVIIGIPYLLYTLLIGMPIDFFQFMFLLPIYRLKAWDDRIQINVGVVSWPVARILKDEIIAIQATDEILAKYTRWLGLPGLKGWTPCFFTTGSRGLLIETTRKKYVLNPPDAGVAAETLRKIFGIEETELKLELLQKN